MKFRQLVEYLKVFIATHIWKILVSAQTPIIQRSADRSPKDSARKRLLVDVGSLYVNNTISGTNRVTLSIALALLQNGNSSFTVELVRFRSWRAGVFPVGYSLLNGGLQLTSTSKKPVPIFTGDMFLGLDLSHLSTVAHSSLFRLMRNKGCKVSFVLYDLLPVDYPQFFPLGTGLKRLHEQWLKVVAEADLVFPISKTVNGRWEQFLDSKNIATSLRPFSKVIHLGSNFNQQPSHSKSSSKLDFLFDTKFMMAVGTIEPRKKIDQILGALELLWETDSSHWLVIVGKPGWLTDELQQRLLVAMAKGQRVVWISDCSDEDLAWLYSNTSLLIAASLDEGYGLPIIEALSFGAKVLARDIQVFREVGGEAAEYFHGDDPASLTKAIRVSLNQFPHGRGNVVRPHWDDCSNEILSELLV